MDDTLIAASPFRPLAHSQNGDRINDHHLSLAEKRAAREAAK